MCLNSKSQNFVVKGTVVKDGEGFYTTPDRTFAFARIGFSNMEAGEAKSSFLPAVEAGSPLTAASPEAAAALAALANAGVVEGTLPAGTETQMETN